MVFLALSALKNKKEEIVLFQIFCYFFDIMANFVLGGYSGAVVVAASLARNILVYKNKMSNVAVCVIMTVMTVCGISVNRHGWIGVLPVMANAEYTLWLWYGGTNPRGIKISMAANVLIWAVYDFTIQAFPAFISDVVIFAVTVFGIWKPDALKKRASQG